MILKGYGAGVENIMTDLVVGWWRRFQVNVYKDLRGGLVVDWTK